MGAYKYMQELARRKQSDVSRYLTRIRTWQWRQMPKIVRLRRPTRTEKAHALGYKAKAGFVMVRVALRRGGRKRPARKGIVYGKPKAIQIHHIRPARNLRAKAESRAGRKFSGLRVLNSYSVGQDQSYAYFEVILLDPQHSNIRKNPRTQWIVAPVHKHREARGLTSAGRQHRGLRNKGHRANAIIGSSRRAHWKSLNTLKLKRYR